METKTQTQTQTQTQTKPQKNMKRSSSSHSESQSHLDSPHSPLRFHSPLRSDQGDPPETPPYASPIGSPEKPPPDNSKAIVAVDKFTPFSPLPSPLLPKPHPPENAATSVAKSPPVVLFNRAVTENGHQATTTKVGPAPGGGSGAVSSIRKRTKMEEMVNMAALGFRLSEVVLCLISFSVMAADKTQGWSGDSFDRYKEYRYCLSVNIIAFVYSGFQACDLTYYMAKEKHVIHHHLRRPFDFFMDQILAYLLISASSSAATRVDDWQSNWGKDEFTKMASASIAMSFLAFIAFAFSSLISGYNICSRDST